MRRAVSIAALLLALSGSSGAEPPPRLQRWHPAGGWNPYGGGVLHWWNRSWYALCGTPDDYGRKPPPPFRGSPCPSCTYPGVAPPTSPLAGPSAPSGIVLSLPREFP